jgi:hypothetical protein
MNWLQTLFSKRVYDANPLYKGEIADDYHILNTCEKEYTSMMDKLYRPPYNHEIDRAVFIRDNGSYFHIGVEAAIKDVLGDNSPYAHESTLFMGKTKIGRPIDFLHNYFSKKSPGLKIPDLKELLEKQKGHLDDILSRANASDALVSAPAVSFELPRVGGSDWDRVASEFEQGRHQGKIAIFSKDGLLSKIMEIDPQKVAHASGTGASGGAKSATAVPGGAGGGGNTAQHAAANNTAQKKTSPRMRVYAMVIAAVAVIGVGIALVWQKRDS